MSTIEAKCIECGHPFLINFPERADSGTGLDMEHAPHWGNHQGYACGFSAAHCWGCNEPWPCRAEAARIDALRDRIGCDPAHEVAFYVEADSIYERFDALEARSRNEARIAEAFVAARVVVAHEREYARLSADREETT